MTTILIDGGYFVGRFEKHWWNNPKRKNMKYWWEQGKSKKITKEVRDAHLKRLLGYDLTYLQMKIKEIGDVDRVIVCYDGIYGRRPRGALYDLYKQNRRGSVLAHKHTGIDVRERIKRTGHDPHELHEGWEYVYDDYKEADDLIAELCLELHSDTHLTIMTKDNDLIQLMALNNVNLHDFTNLLSPEYVETRFGVTCKQYLEFKALSGDKSDNIPGIVGIGVKTAAKYLRKHGSIDNFPKDLLSVEDSEKVRLWKKLTHLPFHHD